MKKTGLWIFLVAAFLIGISGCTPLTGDFDDPVITAEIVNGVLYAEAFDYGSGVAEVKVMKSYETFAYYSEGFRSICYNLSALGFGYFEIIIKATDTAGNSTSLHLYYSRLAYEVEEVIVDSSITGIRNSYGYLIAMVNVECRRLIYHAIEDVPPKPDALRYDFKVTNLSPMTLYYTSLTMAALDENDEILWAVPEYTGTIYAGRSREFSVLKDIGTIPENYQASFYWY